jgi:hypothetical protein
MKTVFCCILSSDHIEKKLMMMVWQNNRIGINIQIPSFYLSCGLNNLKGIQR